MEAEKKNYQFFQNRQCEFFPCHQGVSEEEFNCLFCYCPLYALGKKCGGKFFYNSVGNKVCTGCPIPHKKESFALILSRYDEVMELIRKNDRDEEEKEKQ